MPSVGPAEMISTGHGLLEGPLWDEKLGFLVADAAVGGVWRMGAGEPQVVVPHRRGIGGLALHENSAVVIGGRNIALKWPAGDAREDTVVLLDNDPANDVIGYNDFTTDAAGRIYVGSLAFVAMDAGRTGKPGHLHVIDLDGSSRVVADDVLLTNGLDFSPDGRRLYHSDSLKHTVYVYDVLDNGDVRNRRTFVTLDEAMPDGLAVDSAGNVWVAEPNSGVVRAYAPDGKPVAAISVPVPMVTSLCFGGADRKDLYIVSGSEGLTTDRGAGVWRARTDVAGKARPLARVAIAA